MCQIKNIITIGSIICFVLLMACQEISRTGSTNSKAISVDSLFNAYHQFKLKSNPFEGTSAGLEEYNNQLVNFISEDFQKDLAAKYGHFLREIELVDITKLSESQALSLKVMKWDAALKKEGLEKEISMVISPMFDLPTFTLMPINQIFSFHLFFSNFADIGSPQPYKNARDYDNWLERVDRFLVWLKTAQANMKDGMSKKIVLSKVIVKKMIGQLDQLTNPNVDDHLFFAVIKKMPSEISPEDKQRLETAYRKMISEKLIPAYKELEEFLTNEYLPAAAETSGIGELPNGKETYQYLIKYHTSTSMTPDDIFELGESEVARISSEMEKVKDQVGFKGNLREFFNHVRTSKEQMPFTKPEQVIANFNSIHERMKGNLSRLFDLKPKADFEVRRTQSFREASASAEYSVGSKDGSRPGVFYVPIPDVARYNKYSDEALFLHEAIPGHHYQLSLQQENDNLPGFLHGEGMGVYVEGWALYSESLGKELGLYEDPYQYFGMLSMEMHRAIRLVVDAGLHAKGWTREEAIQYSLNHEAESLESITSEIERYMIAPGQALAYKVGQLKIRELRDRAEKALGDKFSIKEFHNQVLNSGSLPLVLLEEKIDRWINKQQV